MTWLELLKTVETDVINDLVGPSMTGPAVAKFDNRPTWDNAGPKFDNRPTWDNWNKK